MAIFIGILAAVASGTGLLKTNALIPAGISFLISGIATGIIASHIPYYKNFEAFCGDKFFILKIIPCRYKYLEKIENYGFWIGIFLAIGGLVRRFWLK